MSIRDVLTSEKAPESKSVVARPTTLEAYHQQKLREFADTKENIGELEEHLHRVRTTLASMPASSMLSDEWKQLTDASEDLQRRIAAIKADDQRLDYFLDVGDMLFQYYEAQDAVARGATVTSKPSASRLPANSVLSYFAEETGEVAERTIARAVKASEFDVTDGMNRDKILERYLAVVEPGAIKSGIMPGSGIEPGWGCCPICDIEMTFYQNEALLGCPRCGHEEFILVDSEKPSYKDPPREITYFAYKKINHFNEWLAQFQAKENTDIPQDIIESVMRELRKERISDPKKIKKEKVREVLQKLKLAKWYDHVQQIKNRIQHQMTNLTLSKEMEEKLQYLFKEIQPAFIKYCPTNRSNFLSYPYVLYKLCQLLEMDEFLPCFQLLKSREKLYQQDQVWKQICQEMRWQFIKSI
jgi:predicted  nucleic acid-binding Zn-ribbon protein